MARIKLIPLDEMTEEQQTQYARFPSNLTRGLLRTGLSTAPCLSLGASFRAGSLNAKDRELIILRVAALNGSAYERMQHLAAAKEAGWLDLELEAIERGDHVSLGARTASLLCFVDECVNRVKVSDEAFVEMKRFMSEVQIVEATLLVGLYMMMARFLETLEIDLDDQATPWTNLSVS